jgi:hypothetical protein
MEAAPPSILSFAVIAAVVTTAGTLAGHLLKEIVLARSFETWKQRRAADELYRKYRDPLVLASVELADRFGEILEENPVDFLAADVLSSARVEPAHDASRDRYFLRHKYQSSVYRLAAFLGWVELHRQDLVFLDAGRKDAPRLLEKQIRKIRSDMADGHINTAPNWAEWSDALIFREEQRAIGHAMIVASGDTRTIMDYGTFISALENESHAGNRWLRVVINFLAEAGRHEPDFRLERYRRLLVHLVELIEANEPSRASSRLRERAAKYRERT